MFYCVLNKKSHIASLSTIFRSFRKLAHWRIPKASYVQYVEIYVSLKSTQTSLNEIHLILLLKRMNWSINYVYDTISIPTCDNGAYGTVRSFLTSLLIQLHKHESYKSCFAYDAILTTFSLYLPKTRKNWVRKFQVRKLQRPSKTLGPIRLQKGSQWSKIL